jgi:hypothetical protein
MACTDTTLIVHKKDGKAEKRAEIKEKEKQERERKKYLNRRKEKQNKGNNEKWTIK